MVACATVPECLPRCLRCNTGLETLGLVPGPAPVTHSARLADYCLWRGDSIQLMRLLARVAHACIEGSNFIYTSPGQRLAQVAPGLCTISQQQHGNSTACINEAPQGEMCARQATDIAGAWSLRRSVRRSDNLLHAVQAFEHSSWSRMLHFSGMQSVPIACKAVFACSLARGLHVLASNGSVSACFTAEP